MNSILSEALTKNETAQKKKIVVLMCEGGGGHRAASDSLKEILGKRFNVESVNAVLEMLRPLDTFNKLTSGRFTGEDLYNLCLRRSSHRFIKFFFCHFGFNYLRFRHKRILKSFDKFFQQHAPNLPSLVISTMPLINAALVEAAQKYSVPVVIMPTDLDSESFLLGMDEVKMDEKAKLAVAMPYDDPDLQLKAIREAKLKAKQLFVTGFPVRPACLKKYQPEEIKNLKVKHGIYEDMPTLTLIMGAEGGNDLLAYAQEISKLSLMAEENKSFQLNVCVGRNKKMAKKIVQWVIEQGGKLIKEAEGYTTVSSKEGVFLHVREFTKEVVEIMACCDLIITKTGSCSVNEAIYLGKRLLLDNTEFSSARHVWWEGFNVAFVKKHNLGDAFSDVAELGTKIRALLNQPTQSPSARGDFRLPSFEQNVMNLVESMV